MSKSERILDADTEDFLAEEYRIFALAEGKSLNEVAVEALAEGLGVVGAPRKRRDLGYISKTWNAADHTVEAALAEQDRVDEDLWR